MSSKHPRQISMKLLLLLVAIVPPLLGLALGGKGVLILVALVLLYAVLGIPLIAGLVLGQMIFSSVLGAAKKVGRRHWPRAVVSCKVSRRR